MEKLIEDYLTWDINDETRATISKLVDNNDQENLEKLLGHRLAFGTAGLRGPMGAGYNCMNDLVVLQTVQGLVKYILKEFGEIAKSMGVVIGYDHRRAGSLSSYSFALVAASVLLREGFKIQMLTTFVPTPFVPFGVNHYGSAMGLMFTASHNPKEDNGLKVYGHNGCQIIPPVDSDITSSILEQLRPWTSPPLTEADVLAHERYSDVTSELQERYLERVIASVSNGIGSRCQLRVAYTAMHGVGAKWIQEAHKRALLPSLHMVGTQQLPDPDFPTVRFPNPEEKGALNVAIAYANTENCSLIIANDPDADRMAVAERIDDSEGVIGSDRGWHVFTGNEIGIILGHHQIISHSHKRSAGVSSKPPPPVVLASIVSSRMLSAIARAEGVMYVDTLTGFKWLGNTSVTLQQKGFQVLFSYEEALGYCVGDVIFDKDGISASIAFTELANDLALQGKSVYAHLQELYRTYGYFVSYNTYLFSYDGAVTNRIFNRLRTAGAGVQPCHVTTSSVDDPLAVYHSTYVSHVGEVKVRRIRDITVGYDSENYSPSKVTASGGSEGEGSAVTLPVTPDCHMIMYEFENDVTVILRTSGTEPKIKCYTEIASKVLTDRTQSLLENFVEQCIVELLRPTENNLTRPAGGKK